MKRKLQRGLKSKCKMLALLSLVIDQPTKQIKYQNLTRVALNQRLHNNKKAKVNIIKRLFSLIYIASQVNKLHIWSQLIVELPQSQRKNRIKNQ